jgi:hypothetical protein
LSNFFSATRSYVDHVQNSSVANLLAASHAQTSSVKKRLSDAYDHSLSYRAMEALRNYTQHRGFPINTLSLKTDIDDTQSRNRLKFGCGIYLDLAGFKATVLKELANSEDRVDLKPLVRDYVAALVGTHKALRDDLKEVTTRCDKIFEFAHKQFTVQDETTQMDSMFNAYREENNRRHDVVSISSQLARYRLDLIKLNSSLRRLDVAYATGETWLPRTL